MNANGKFTATAASTVAVAANANRTHLTIQKQNATAIAFGIGESAVADEGIILSKAGETLKINGNIAGMAIYAIGNGGTMTYQEGDVEVACL
jgi:hypothetical protein